MLHGHQDDPAYDDVILHVVFEEDRPVVHPSGERIPCLELKDRIPANILETYQRLEHERAWIPCESFFTQTPDIVRLNWLDRLLVERLEQKTEAIATLLEATGNHWEEAFYRLLARNFGLKVNADPFEMLAASLPLSILAKHKNNAFQIEALLFGQAGLLDPAMQEPYPAALAKEYRFLQNKYKLTPLDGKQWKFLRLRPANFPSVRLAQFSALLHRSTPLLSQILEAASLREIEHLFTVEPGEYWQTHFQLDKPSQKRSKAAILFTSSRSIPSCRFFFITANKKTPTATKNGPCNSSKPFRPNRTPCSTAGATWAWRRGMPTRVSR